MTDHKEHVPLVVVVGARAESVQHSDGDRSRRPIRGDEDDASRLVGATSLVAGRVVIYLVLTFDLPWLFVKLYKQAVRYSNSSNKSEAPEDELLAIPSPNPLTQSSIKPTALDTKR